MTNYSPIPTTAAVQAIDKAIFDISQQQEKLGQAFELCKSRGDERGMKIAEEKDQLAQNLTKQLYDARRAAERVKADFHLITDLSFTKKAIRR